MNEIELFSRDQLEKICRSQLEKMGSYQVSINPAENSNNNFTPFSFSAVLFTHGEQRYSVVSFKSKADAVIDLYRSVERILWQACERNGSN